MNPNRPAAGFAACLGGERLAESRPWPDLAAKAVAGLLGSATCLVIVTAAIYLFREAVPVLSLGALYLFAVLPAAVLWGRVAVGAVVSMLAFNFFFLPPEHTLRLEERTNWFALAVYLVTGIVVSELAARARMRAAEAEQREREEALLAELSIALLQGEHLETGSRRLLGRLRASWASHARLELGEHPDVESHRAGVACGQSLGRNSRRARG